ncbi:hypothetical protein [Streptacidiphilus sp. EB129]|uniref:hypothetical protein n=1 Tax=Streptacidiphilus sp. EB129 TaxID=3156262 RepID=UPI0035167F86
MRSTPTAALIAVISSAAGLLIGWYSPAPALPTIVFAVLAYAVTVVLLAAAFRIKRDDALAGTSLLIIRTLVVTLQTAAGAILHLLTSAEQWLTQHQHTASTSYIHAA